MRCNGHLSALRAWCAWLTEERYLEVNPARRIKLVGRQEASSREGLSDIQTNALLRQAQASRDGLRNYAIVQVLLQLCRMVLGTSNSSTLNALLA